ncbi:MAG: hypothetical protein GY869_09095, partial [Planctomycetes bacterium]|nr:hypothetical protein [Planctomycetota bacterium]
MGYNYNGTINGSNFAGEAQGNICVGGLVGENDFGKIFSCFSSGVVARSTYVGGLTGNNVDSISQSYSISKISGTTTVGGLSGGNFGQIDNCYALGEVTGDTFIGGLVGNNHADSGAILNCYSSGNIIGTGMNVGGMVGQNTGSISQSFWDIDTSGLTISSGGIGKATTDMLKQSTFTEMGWDFCGEIINGGKDIWCIAEGNGYPRLVELYQYSGGNGQSNDPFLINSFLDLKLVSANPEKHFRLMVDIDMAGEEYTESSMIGHYPDDPFTGTFNGNGHIIRNISLSGAVSNYTGFFGYVAGADVEIKKLGLENITIEANTNDFIGGMVGYNYGATISECFVTGSILGWDSVGGLVGYNEHGIINNCYIQGQIEGMWFAGGIAGTNWQGAISNNYAAVEVWGFDAYGGLVGFNKDGSINECFLDAELSGNINPIGYIDGGVISISGKSTTDMMGKSSYISKGWDFTQETVNGTEDIWDICDWVHYPRLAWQILDG